MLSNTFDYEGHSYLNSDNNDESEIINKKK